MEAKKQRALVFACAAYFEANNESSKKSDLVKKFIEFGAGRSTAYRYYNILSSGGDISPKERPKRVNLTNRVKKRITNMCENRIFPGYRKIGRKLKCHHRTAKRLVQEAKLHVQHRKKVPKSNENQQKTQQKRMNRLRRAIGKAWVVMDDETYFDLEGHPFFGGN